MPWRFRKSHITIIPPYKETLSLNQREYLFLYQFNPVKYPWLKCTGHSNGNMILSVYIDNVSAVTDGELEMVEFEMNLLQAMKAAPETANYNRGAYNTGNTMGVTPGGFDAKQ